MLAIRVPKYAGPSEKKLRGRTVIGVASAILSVSSASSSDELSEVVVDGGNSRSNLLQPIPTDADGFADCAKSGLVGWPWGVQSFLSSLSIKELLILHHCVSRIGSLEGGLQFLDGLRGFCQTDVRSDYLEMKAGHLFGKEFVEKSQWKEFPRTSDLSLLLRLQEDEIARKGERLLEDVRDFIAGGIDQELSCTLHDELPFELFKNMIYVASTSGEWNGKRVSSTLWKLKLREASTLDLRRVYSALKIEAIANKLTLMIPSQFSSRVAPIKRSVGIEQLRALSANTSEYAQIPAANIHALMQHVKLLDKSELLALAGYCRHILSESAARQKSLAYEFMNQLHEYSRRMEDFADTTYAPPSALPTEYTDNEPEHFPSKAELEQLSGPAFTIYAAIILSDHARMLQEFRDFNAVIPRRLTHQNLLIAQIVEEGRRESYTVPPAPHPYIDISSKLDYRVLAKTKRYFLINSYMRFVNSWKQRPHTVRPDPTEYYMNLDLAIGKGFFRRAVSSDGAKCVKLLEERGDELPGTYAELVARMYEIINGFTPEDFGAVSGLTSESPDFFREHYIRATCLASPLCGIFQPTAPVDYSKKSYQFLGQLWNHQIKTNLEYRMGIPIEARFCDGLYQEVLGNTRDPVSYPYNSGLLISGRNFAFGVQSFILFCIGVTTYTNARYYEEKRRGRELHVEDIEIVRA